MVVFTSTLNLFRKSGKTNGTLRLIKSVTKFPLKQHEGEKNPYEGREKTQKWVFKHKNIKYKNIICFSETRRIRIIDEEDSSGFTEATKIDHEKLKLKEKIEKLEKLVNGKSVEEECQNNNRTPVKPGAKDPSAPAVVEGAAPQRGFFSPCYMTLNGDKSYQYQVISLSKR